MSFCTFNSPVFEKQIKNCKDHTAREFASLGSTRIRMSFSSPRVSGVQLRAGGLDNRELETPNRVWKTKVKVKSQTSISSKRNSGAARSVLPLRLRQLASTSALGRTTTTLPGQLRGTSYMHASVVAGVRFFVKATIVFEFARLNRTAARLNRVPVGALCPVRFSKTAR